MSRLVTVLFIVFFLSVPIAKGVEILSKSKLQRCENDSDSQSKDVKCENKIVLDIAVPSGSSGGEASLVARLVQVEENDTQTIRIRHPPIITIKKSAAYVIYELTYIRDVAYRPQEHYVETHKCESDADSNVVGDCERLRDENGNVIEHTQADHNRVVKNEPPQYVVAGRFERINQHPDAGPNSFSIGVSEAVNTNLLLELSADDIEYVYQRSPGKILDIRIPTFEVLKRFGTANVTVKNTGNLEASYSLTFDCAQGVSPMEEQFFILKPNEVVNRMFDLHPNTDQAGKYNCSAILKASDFSEINRKECQFTTTATVLDNGTQIVVADERNNGIKGFFRNLWHGIVDFFTGKTCR
ncbi:hypothetical protein LUZ60_012956 [Juncus effusus]|nr:hypothetical protein LUZ60_012956 [Juncus effusus]